MPYPNPNPNPNPNPKLSPARPLQIPFSWLAALGCSVGVVSFGKYRGGVGSALPSRKHVALMLGDVCVLLCAFPVSVMRIGSHVRQLILTLR